MERWDRCEDTIRMQKKLELHEKKSSKSSLRLTLKDTLSCSLSRKHDILLHRNYGGTFWFSKKFLTRVRIFSVLKRGSPGRTCQIRFWSPLLKNWIVYLWFHFLNLARLYSWIILIVLSYVFVTIILVIKT